MAKDKKSFVLYADIIHTVKHLTDVQSGQLFKHLLAYVNDVNPVIEDPIINIAFEPIKQQLKRDLRKYEDIKSKRSEAGKKSAKARKQKASEQNQQKLTSVESVKQTPTNPTVNVNDNVNVTDNVINKKESDKEKPTSPASDEGTFHDIEKLKLRYDDPKLKNAICKNMGVSEQILKISLEQFNADLKSEGRFYETQKEYSRYFLNCIKSGKYPKQKTKKFKSPTDLTF